MGEQVYPPEGQEYGAGFRTYTLTDCVCVELVYPRLHKRQTVEVGMEDLRAADSVRLSYDYDRDGWVVRQASRFSFEAGDEVCDQDWQEVAFVKAWGREEESR